VIHYHCADIHPLTKFLGLEGRHLLVSHAYPRRVKEAHRIGQSVLLDNGAFSVWRSSAIANWDAYYEWCDQWFHAPTTWAIIPDVIDAGPEAQDNLLAQWPHGERGAPVWHTDEPLDRLLRLVADWPRVCVGSSSKHQIGTDNWRRIIDKAFNALSRRNARLAWLHGLRMQSVSSEYPFGSVDSADVARNNNRKQNSVKSLCERWDKIQPPVWVQRPEQRELLE